MCELKELQDLVTEFRDERDWEKYHTPKNLSISISIEAAELMELFQWHSDLDRVEEEDLKDEMADILIYLLSLSEITNVDLNKAVRDKIKKNREKYPK